MRIFIPLEKKKTKITQSHSYYILLRVYGGVGNFLVRQKLHKLYCVSSQLEKATWETSVYCRAEKLVSVCTQLELHHHNFYVI